jgi:excisionase family DNA binding protein
MAQIAARPDRRFMTSEQPQRGTIQGAATFVSIREAAARASVSTRTIKRWISAGHLSAVRLPSPKALGHLRVRVNDLEVLMARGTIAP